MWSYYNGWMSRHPGFDPELFREWLNKKMPGNKITPSSVLYYIAAEEFLRLMPKANFSAGMEKSLIAPPCVYAGRESEPFLVRLHNENPESFTPVCDISHAVSPLHPIIVPGAPFTRFNLWIAPTEAMECNVWLKSIPNSTVRVPVKQI